MGASQSSGRGGTGGGGGSNREKTPDGIDLQDYYGLLELTPEATSDEIRKAYRKLALRFHPDKNRDDVEAANKRFALIGQAYEVLSDEQERAWYDNHRDAILSGRGDGDGEAEGAADAQFDEEDFKAFQSGKAKPAPAGSNSPGLTVRHLMRFLDPSLASDVRPPSADEGGFFGTYRRLFERLAEEERNAAPYPGESNGPVPLREDFPSFGYSHTPYLFPKGEEPPVGQTQLRDFYAVWSGFSSRKGFGWKDGYKVNEAPDRRVKRLMEKENKSMRESARREYNDMVRSIVAFIRKRDPRVKAHLAQVQSSSVGAASAGSGGAGKVPLTEAQKERMKKDVEAKRAEQEAAAAAYQAQGWNTQQFAFSDDEESEEGEAESGSEEDEEGGSGEGDEENGPEDNDDEEDEPDQWDCVACDKLFRSRAAWENHERSKKHRQEVWRLKKEMRKEEKAMGLAPKHDGDGPDEADVEELEEEFSAGMRVSNVPSAADSTSGQQTPLSKKARQKLKKRQKAAGLALDEDGYLAETLEDRRAGEKEAATADSSRVASDGEEEAPRDSNDVTGQTTPDESAGTPPQQQQQGKARRGTKDKKKGKAVGGGEVCNVCKAAFPSRSKLFNHLRDSGHARAEAAVSGAGNGDGKQVMRDMDDWSEEDGPPKKGRKGKRR